MLQIFLALQAIVARHKVHVVGQVGGVRALRLHVAFYGVVLLGRRKGDGELEEARGDFGGAEIAEAGFEVDEVGEEGGLWEECAVVVD